MFLNKLHILKFHKAFSKLRHLSQHNYIYIYTQTVHKDETDNYGLLVAFWLTVALPRDRART